MSTKTCPHCPRELVPSGDWLVCPDQVHCRHREHQPEAERIAEWNELLGRTA